MRDVSDEIKYILNLILKDKLNDTDLLNSHQFIDKTRGYVSYLKNKFSDIKITYYGESLLNTNFIIYPDIMEKDGAQNKRYLEIINNNKIPNKRHILEQISLFSRNKSNSDYKEYMKKQYSTENQALEELKKYSIIYYNLIKVLPKEKEGKVFIYSIKIEKSGLNILKNILTQKFHKKCLFLKGSQSVADGELIIKKFNADNNKNGEKYQILLGSPIAEESFTFRNVIQLHILTPWWNYTRIEQVIGRIIRYKSHDDDIKKKGIGIYQHVAIPVSQNGKELYEESINFEYYKTCIKKDMKIKKIERLLKENAIDCALNYQRNRVRSTDKNRECEYTSCEYDCIGFDNNIYKETDILSPCNKLNNSNCLEMTTFNLYYSDNIISEIILQIQNLFRKEFLYTFSDLFKKLQEMIPNIILFQVINALQKIINEYIIILDKYGIECYLKENNNDYFLYSIYYESNTNDITSIDSYYTEYPTIINTNKFSDVLTPMFIDKILNYIEKNPIKLENLLKLFNTMNLDNQEFLLENIILAEKNDINIYEKARKIIIKYYLQNSKLITINKNYENNVSMFNTNISKYMRNNNISYVSLLRRSDEKYKCFYKIVTNNNGLLGKWSECNKLNSIIQQSINNEKEKLLKYDIYGIIEDYKFKIKTVSEDERKNKAKGHTISKGAECLTKDIDQLIEYNNKLQIKYNPDFDYEKDNINMTIYTDNSSIEDIKKNLEKIKKLYLCKITKKLKEVY